MRQVSRIVAASLLLVTWDGHAEAHSFGVMYNLPIPFWMYAFAAAATLALSFLIIGFLVTGESAKRVSRLAKIRFIIGPVRWRTLRILSVFLLSLTIATGLLGTQNPTANFNLTFFWIGFVLGFTYLTALIGDFYEFINPWRAICEMIERSFPGAFNPRVHYPAWLAYYPAFGLYMGFIWLELFGHTTPRTISLALLGYSALNLAAAAIFGAKTWFYYGEFFSMFFRLVGKISPVAFVQNSGQNSQITVRFRAPFTGLIEETADHLSILLFVLFMLASTAFDGLHETLPWVELFWKYIYPPLTWTFDRPYSFFVEAYYGWQVAMLWLSPFIYLAIYLIFISITTARDWSLRKKALLFCYSLIPIAFVYNVSHYFTLLFTDAPRLLSLILDPFGMGGDPLGMVRVVQQFSAPPPARFVWHIQVGLILFGHVVSVYLAHAEATRVLPEGHKALWSQFPMLVLMIAFTTAGLWILSLPIGAGQVRDPAPVSSVPPPHAIAQKESVRCA